MKTRWIHLTAGLTMFVLCISVCTTKSNAAIVWQDNFDDGIPDGWTFFGYEGVFDPDKIEGNFSVADGTLKVLDNDINLARHDSTVTVGTWSFDMFVPDDGYGSIYVEFMSNGSSILGNGSEFVAVGAWLQEHKFVVWEITEISGIDTWDVLSHIHVEPLQGWHHIDVTRTNEGHFKVYFNGTVPTLATPSSNFTNNDVTSSTYLQFWCNNATGAAIDNLIVRDDIITPTPSTPIIDDTPWILIAVGGGVAVGVIVLAIVCLRRR